MEQVVRETADMQTTVIEIGVTSGLCLSRNPTLRKFKSVVQAEMGNLFSEIVAYENSAMNRFLKPKVSAVQALWR